MAPNQRLNQWNYLGMSVLHYENIERFTRRAVVPFIINIMRDLY